MKNIFVQSFLIVGMGILAGMLLSTLYARHRLSCLALHANEKARDLAGMRMDQGAVDVSHVSLRLQENNHRAYALIADVEHSRNDLGKASAFYALAYRYCMDDAGCGEEQKMRYMKMLKLLPPPDGTNMPQ